jgi:hypothetical protein
MPNAGRNGDKKWRHLRDIGSFLLGAYLLVRTNNPSTIEGLIALALMGVLPWSIIEQWINRNGK